MLECPAATVREFRVADLAKMSVEEAVQALLRRAVELRASDLFLLSDARYITVAVRRMGRLQRLAMLSTEFGRQLMAHIKAYSEMDISEKRRPADGRWISEMDDRRIDLRINFTPTLYGEDLTIRVSDHARGGYQLHELGLSSSELSRLTGMLDLAHGLLLVTGPTGAGKTTSLYACLRHLNDGTRKINTIEDPIEYSLDGVRQSPVNVKLGLDFGELLRNVLRQAPDVIMIGEIRDPDTMTTAIRAANSGLLVLATMHAPAAADTLQSMMALGANPYFLSNCLLGVVSQRLARTLCPKCRTPVECDPALFQEVADQLPATQGRTIFNAAGCDECFQLGYGGRTGLFEIMPVNSTMRRMIAQSAPLREIETEAIRAGMIDLRRATLLNVANGRLSAEYVLGNVPVEFCSADAS